MSFVILACLGGCALIAGYIVCDYVVKRIKHERDKKWTDQ